MTSQVSILKLLKQEIRQNGWMFGLTCLIHFLSGPVIFLLDTSSYSTTNIDNAITRYSRFYTDTYFIWQIIVMILCICIAIFIYRYLFSKRMVDLYHSVPISRSKLFLVKYLHGVLIWLLPFVVCGICVLLLFTFKAAGTTYFLPIAWKQIKCMLLLIFCFFIFYHLFLVAVYISGNVINMITNTGIIGASIIGLWAAGHALAGTYFDTYAYNPPPLVYDIMYSLSPFVSPFGIYFFLAGGELAASHFPLLILSLLVTFGLLELAWILYLKRPSELAERGTINKHYLVPARLIISLLAGVGGAMFFCAISPRADRIGWGIFGALLGSIVCFGAVNSIFQATIKAFFKHRLQIILSAACSVLIILSFQLDIFGYDRYLPDKEDIAGMAIYSHQLTDDSGYIQDYYTTVQHSGNPILQSTYYVSQDELVTDPELCYDLLYHFAKEKKDGNVNGYYAKIKLKNGRTYERYYRLSNSQPEKIKPFVEIPSYQNANYKFSNGSLGYPTELTVDLIDVRFDAGPEDIEKIMNAYYEDFKEHYTIEELSSYLSVYDLSGKFNNYHFWLDIHSNYDRTLAVLEELYPEYKTTVTTYEEIKELRVYADIYKHMDYDDNRELTIDALYEYFGYEGNDFDDVLESDTADESTEEVLIASNAVPQATISYLGATAEIVFTEANDSEIIQKLYPLLYFGQYRSMFDQKEYIYIGTITTTRNSTINCYVKPGTLPEEIIHMLYDERVEY